jgi:hypothetical protein
LEITIICWNLLAGSASRQNKTVMEISDRYVFNIFATLGTFALSLDIYGSRQENPA